MSTVKPKESPLFTAARAVSEELDADVILFNQPVYRWQAYDFHRRLEDESANHKNVFLMLVTLGGDPHAAYTIARDLQLRYDKIMICIGGDCYSSGTLIALSAHELVITDRGRLGPLDVQRVLKDEYLERMSGLTLNIALDELRKKAVESLIAIAKDLKESYSSLSFKTALDISGNMVASMFGEMYKQIDPVKLGDDARALQVAVHYGNILGKASSNLKNCAIERLLSKYPSHECIIDRTEATELFKKVRPPDTKEMALLNMLGEIATDAMQWDDRMLIIFPTNKKEDSVVVTEDEINVQASEQTEGQESGGNGKPSGSTKGTSGGDGSPGKKKSGTSK